MRILFLSLVGISIFFTNLNFSIAQSEEYEYKKIAPTIPAKTASEPKRGVEIEHRVVLNGESLDRRIGVSFEKLKLDKKLPESKRGITIEDRLERKESFSGILQALNLKKNLLGYRHLTKRDDQHGMYTFTSTQILFKETAANGYPLGNEPAEPVNDSQSQLALLEYLQEYSNDTTNSKIPESEKLELSYQFDKLVAEINHLYLQRENVSGELKDKALETKKAIIAAKAKVNAPLSAIEMNNPPTNPLEMSKVPSRKVNKTADPNSLTPKSANPR